MTIKLKSFLLILLLAMLITGCSSGPVQLHTTKPLDISYQRSRNISSSACGFQLLMFIPIRVNSRFQRAYDQLVTLAAGDPIGEIRVQEFWRYAFIGTSYCTQLVAKVYSK